MAVILEDLVVERPVAGGDMLARHEGRVVFVSGAIPGERVRAEVVETKRHMVWARTVAVIEASPDRRTPASDPACGGLVYAHMTYARQCALKGEVIVDAFRRLGKMTLPVAPAVATSPEAGYRWRARLHVRERRAGFFLEGTHAICDPAPSCQLLPATSEVVARVLAALGPRADACESMVLAENVDATERIVHLEAREKQHLDVSELRLPDGLVGVTGRAGRRLTVAGQPFVSDTASRLLASRSDVPPDTTWRRGPESFFQANRYLTGTLLNCVLDHGQGARVADLYAGVGLFAVGLAASGAAVLAVEGDPQSAEDLAANAQRWRPRLTTLEASVEDVSAALRSHQPEIIVVDPPRAGLSRPALENILAATPQRVVYVSCDPATLARDAAALVAGEYDLGHVEAFDLFPNTAHVETVAVFDRR